MRSARICWPSAGLRPTHTAIGWSGARGGRASAGSANKRRRRAGGARAHDAIDIAAPQLRAVYSKTVEPKLRRSMNREPNRHDIARAMRNAMLPVGAEPPSASETAALAEEDR